MRKEARSTFPDPHPSHMPPSSRVTWRQLTDVSGRRLSGAWLCCDLPRPSVNRAMTSTYPRENSSPVLCSPVSFQQTPSGEGPGGAFPRGESAWTRDPLHGERQRGHESLSTGESAWTQEPFHGERQCGHGSLSTGRVSVGTGAFLRGELAWTQEPVQGESQCGQGSLSTGRVSMDMGAFPRGESAWTLDSFHWESPRGHGKGPGVSAWPVSWAGPVPFWPWFLFCTFSLQVLKNQLKQKENKTKSCASQRKWPPGDPAPD